MLDITNLQRMISVLVCCERIGIEACDDIIEIDDIAFLLFHYDTV